MIGALRTLIGRVSDQPPTPLALAWPRRYINPGAAAELDIEQYSERYEWRQDPAGGLIDTLKPPAAMVEDPRGDCEDYAFLAASWAIAADQTPVALGLCTDSYLLRHTVAIAGVGTGDECVYSSGAVYDGLDTYREQMSYDRLWVRPI